MYARGAPAPGRAMEPRKGHFPTAGAAGRRILDDALSRVSLQPLQPPLWCQLVPKHHCAQPPNGAQAGSGMPGCTFGSEHRPSQAEALQTLGTLLHVPAEGNDP